MNGNHSDQKVDVRRLAFIYEGVAYGGIEEYLLLLLRYLNREHYAPMIVTPGYNYKFVPRRFIKEVESLGVPFLRTPDSGATRVLSSYEDIKNLYFLFRSTSTSIVHIHNSNPDGGRRATLAARLAGVNAVVRSEHLPPSSNVRFHSKYSLKLQDWLTDYIIVGSEACREEQLTLLRRRAEKTICNYYGIELDRFSPQHDVAEAKRRVGLDPALPVVGKVARLSPEKGHVYFIDAAAEVIQKFGPVNFVLVGNGPLEDQLRTQVAHLGIEQYVHFVGFQPDTVPYIQAMDVTVMSSINEGISLAMLEFMAMGKPVVATSEPSFAETVIDGESGIIVELKNAVALARGILNVLDNPSLAARLGRAAYERVHNIFNIRTNVEYLMDLYDQLLENRNGVRARTIRSNLMFPVPHIYAALSETLMTSCLMF